MKLAYISSMLRWCVSKQFASVKTKPEYGVLSLVRAFREGADIPDTVKASVISEISDKINRVTRAKLGELLVSSAYSGLLSQDHYDRILSHLSRTEPVKGDKGFNLSDIRVFDMMVRCGLVPSCSYTALSQSSQRYLLRARSKVLDRQEKSSMAKEIQDILEGIAQEYYPDVDVGAYAVDFVKLGEAGVSANHRDTTTVPDLKVLMRKYVAINPIPKSEIRGSVARPAAQVRASILESVGLRLVHVPYPDWVTLENLPAKKTYLTKLIADRQLQDS